MTKSLLITTLLCSSVALAQKAEVKKASFKELALAEANAPYDTKAKPATTATDAQLANGMLTLKDPRPDLETRSWKYFAGLTVQSFQADGKVTSDLQQTFDLSKNGQTAMPGLELGVLSPEMATGDVNWRLGVKGKGAYSSQKSNVTLTSGYEIDDARLNTTLLSVGPVVSASWNRFNWLSLNLGAQYGDLNYTQTSSSEFGQFSKHAGYQAFSYGLGFQITRTWSVSTDWNQRTLKSNTQDLALQKNNFELGTTITW